MWLITRGPNHWLSKEFADVEVYANADKEENLVFEVERYTEHLMFLSKTSHNNTVKISGENLLRTLPTVSTVVVDNKSFCYRFSSEDLILNELLGEKHLGRIAWMKDEC